MLRVIACLLASASVSPASASVSPAPPRAWGVTFWGVLKSAIERPDGRRVFIQAGDLTQMWLRDATASVHHWFGEPSALRDRAVIHFCDNIRAMC